MSSRSTTLADSHRGTRAAAQSAQADISLVTRAESGTNRRKVTRRYRSRKKQAREAARASVAARRARAAHAASDARASGGTPAPPPASDTQASGAAGGSGGGVATRRRSARMAGEGTDARPALSAEAATALSQPGSSAGHARAAQVLSGARVQDGDGAMPQPPRKRRSALFGGGNTHVDTSASHPPRRAASLAAAGGNAPSVPMPELSKKLNRYQERRVLLVRMMMTVHDAAQVAAVFHVSLATVHNYLREYKADPGAFVAKDKDGRGGHVKPRLDEDPRIKDYAFTVMRTTDLGTGDVIEHIVEAFGEHYRVSKETMRQQLRRWGIK